jgi:outer membrane usher protein
LERTQWPSPRHEASVSLAMPLRIGGARQSLQSNVRTASDDLGVQLGMQGTGRDDRLAWSVGALHSSPRERNAATTASGSLAWRGDVARIGTALSTSPTARNVSATLDGAVLLHPHGATFAPALGDTLALLRSPGAAGARLAQDPARRLDRHGHAVVASLSPYRRNRVGIDPRGAPASTHFAFTERDVVPRAGAVLEVLLPTTHAPERWLRLASEDGAPPPFAAQVVDPHGTELGRVGRDGIAWIRAPIGTPHVEVRWTNEGETASCRITLDEQDAGLLRETLCKASPQ